jgi:hypothetical protein
MTDKSKFNGWTPKIVIVKASEIAKDKNLNLSPKYWIEKKTEDKMAEYIKNNSVKSLKDLIKRFYKK